MSTEALVATQQAAEQFSEFGDRRRIAHAQRLKAVLLNEKGDVGAALAILLRLKPLFGRAVVSACDCLFVFEHSDRVGDLDQARAFYVRKGIASEIARRDWHLGVILIAEQNRAEGIEACLAASAAFDSLGMPGEAGFVKLAITEEYVAEEQWEDAETFAREAARTSRKRVPRFACWRPSHTCAWPSSSATRALVQ